jgi:hypothetical protein
MGEPIKPFAILMTNAHEHAHISRTQFIKLYVKTGLIKPVDLGARGLSVVLAELEAVLAQRVADIRAGKIVPPVRTSRAVGSTGRRGPGRPRKPRKEPTRATP